MMAIIKSSFHIVGYEIFIQYSAASPVKKEADMTHPIANAPAAGAWMTRKTLTFPPGLPC
jgi:hypothetical protein